MATTMEDDFKFTLEVHFAQRLAGNVTKIRERTVKKLKRWISARSTKQGGVGMEELLRLWKGLFYCMWMCDKPVIQEELADRIADLIHSFTTPQGAMAFFEAFLLTMKREWVGIDRLRMDKYFMFVRRCFRQTLVVLRNNDWEESVVDQFLAVLCKTPLSADPDASPDGLRYHFIDIYREELAACAGKELTTDQVMKLIDPFCVLVTSAHNKTLLKVILRGFFQEIVDESDVGFPDDSEDEGIDSGEDDKGDGKKDEDVDEDDEDEAKEREKKKKFVRKEIPKLKYDYEAIANRLFALASQKSIQGPFRKKVYAMVKKFRDLKEGVFPDYNMGSLLDYQDDGEEYIFGDRLPPKKKKARRRGGKQVRERKLASADKRAAKDKEAVGDVGGLDKDDEAEEDDVVKEEEEVPQKRRRTRRRKKHTGDIDGAGGMASVETNDDTADHTSEKAVMETETKVPDEEHTNGVEAEGIDERKRKGKKRKSDGNHVKASIPNGDDAPKNNEVTKSVESMMIAQTSELTPADTSSVGSETGSAEKHTKKSKKRKSNAIEREPTDTADKIQADDSNKTPEKIKQTASEESELQLNLFQPTKISNAPGQLTGDSKQQTPTGGGKQKTGKPFAAFHHVSTPPALVRHQAIRKDGQPQTEPPRRKGTLLSDDTDSDQATPKKRVKIALGLNIAHASKDYKKQLQESPGIPFDGSKKPIQSVLKTPSPKHRLLTAKQTTPPTFKTPSPKSSPLSSNQNETPVFKTPSPNIIKDSGGTSSSKKNAKKLRRSLRIARPKKY